MRNIIFLFVLFTLVYCTKKTETNPKIDFKENVNKNLIDEVRINVVGGHFGQKVFYKIDEDSIIYKYSMEANSEITKTTKQKNNLQSWMNLLQQIDIENFKNAKEGKSLQPFDGLDTEVIIKIKDSTFTKRNADENESWNGIMEVVRTYKD